MARTYIKEQRIRADLEALAAITDPEQPYTRRSFTELYQDGRRWLEARMQEAGLETRLDAAANVRGRWEGGGNSQIPAILLGSHTDTVLGGGRFDGPAGVVAALEVVRSLREEGVSLRHPLEVVDFLAEEVSDYGPSCIGSRGLAGNLTAEMLALTNSHGETLAQGIRRMGGQPERLLESRELEKPAAYLELHIEQGRVLERQGAPVGVVTGIVGIRRYLVRIQGQADHAGATPMDQRRDALAGAAKVISLVEEISRKKSLEEYFVGTVGLLTVSPNSSNVVPGAVEFTVEFRSLNPELTLEAWEEWQQRAEAELSQRQLFLTAKHLTTSPPIHVSKGMQDVLHKAARRVGVEAPSLPSGGGHDAIHMAKITQAAMLFIPCRDGRSHTPEEWSEYRHVALGAAVLREAVLELDRTL